MRDKKIGILMGGISSERDISIKSGTAVYNSLQRQGYNAKGIDVGRDVCDTLLREKIDIAFIALHGRWGEDGTVQGLLELMAIPYTGSGIVGSAISMDKIIMKRMLNAIGVPTPEYEVSTGIGDIKLPLPFVVKPPCEGSTIGISIVKSKEEVEKAIETAFQYDRKVLIERYIEGDEITVGIVNGKILPVIQVVPKKGFYDFEAKYTKGMTEYVIPARIDEKVDREAKELAIAIYEAFQLSGCVRIDMLVERTEGIPLVIDINTSPGMTETSLVPKAWAHLGGTFDELVVEILKGASLKI
ncbi:MAG: D-alanine--D-alanine ligase [Syntrophorhabdaceae bacterium]|nr:D-alanine--D-alanine ligase [Syntrophorhabdaceae bacterium]